MQALRTHVAGVDVHKEILAITILIGRGDEEPKGERLECTTFTDDLRACGVVLLEKGVRDVLMESTGVYWKPVYNVWSAMGINCVIGNARHMKNVPGRKTDQNDADWAATLHRFGLVRPSFIPGGEFQRMRLWTRHRTNLVNDLARVKNRIQKVLEDGNIKWGSIVSDVFGVAGLKILNLISDGVTNPNVLASSVKTKIKRKEEAVKALTNCFTTDHCKMIKELMNQYRDLESRIREADGELCEKAKPHAETIKRLDEIPGIDVSTAITIIAESGTDMTKFKDERSYAAWAGVAAGNNESAGKKKDQNVGLEIRV
jgi:transposase